MNPPPPVSGVPRQGAHLVNWPALIAMPDRVERVERDVTNLETAVDQLQAAHWRAVGLVAGVSGACATAGTLIGLALAVYGGLIGGH